ncbi:MAG: hypothetical protein V7724_07325 [Sediminicola sp.]
MDLLDKNIEESEGSFYEKLHQEGYFDHGLFAEIILFVDNLNGKGLSEIERLRKSCQLWELAYRVQSNFGYSYNKNDAYEIINVEEEKLVEIGQVLEYICRQFTENKQLDLDFIKEMTT